MKIVKKVIIGLFSVLLGLLFIFNIYNFVSVKVLKNDIASINGYAILEVISGSMEPTIHVGDLIIINKNEETYNENDIVTFYDQEGSFVTHRIISINKEEMITKGDNNNSEDKPLPTANIVGKYVTRIPLVGRVLSSIKNPFILTMIFILGLLVCYLLSIDKNGDLILTEEEKEYQEFLEYQKKGKKKKNLKKQQKAEKKELSLKEKKKSKKMPKTKQKKEKPKNKKERLKEELKAELKEELKKELIEELKKELKEEIPEKKVIKQNTKNNLKKKNK